MLFLLSIVVLLLWLIQRHWRMRKILELSRKLKNKHRAWPFVGHALMFLGSAEDRIQTFQKFAREAIKSEYGLTTVWLGSQFVALTCDPTVVEVVTKTCLGKTDEIFKIARHLIGNASFFAPVNIWRPRRKMLAPAFSRKNLRNFFDIFVEQSNVLTHCLKPKVASGTFSIWDNITSYTLDTVCQTVLGINLETQKQPLHPFLLALEKYFETIPVRLIQNDPKWEKLFQLLPIFKKAEQNKSIVHDFLDEIIKNMHTHLSISSEDNLRNKSFLGQFLSNRDEGFTDIELREEMLFLLIVGKNTSAVGLSFTILMLSRHLDVQQKAFEEIQNIFGESKRLVTHEDLPKLKYIEALIKESLRLFPPVPIIVRENHIDVELHSGIVVPAGSYTAINIWGLHRNPRYWGPDAEVFNPDRFLNGLSTDRAAYVPFSYGPRDCLGYKYAMMSMKVLVTTLLRKYMVLPPSDMSAEDLMKPLRLGFSMMLKDVDNYKVRLESRN